MVTTDSNIAKHSKRIIWLEGGVIKKDMANENPINARSDRDYK